MKKISTVGSEEDFSDSSVKNTNGNTRNLWRKVELRDTCYMFDVMDRRTKYVYLCKIVCNIMSVCLFEPTI